MVSRASKYNVLKIVGVFAQIQSSVIFEISRNTPIFVTNYGTMTSSSLIYRLLDDSILHENIACESLTTLLQLASSRIFVLAIESLTQDTEGHHSLSPVTVGRPLNLSRKHLTADKTFHFSFLPIEIYTLWDRLSCVMAMYSMCYIEFFKFSVCEVKIKQLTLLWRLPCVIKMIITDTMFQMMIMIQKNLI